jgi:hypothetical protein
MIRTWNCRTLGGIFAIAVTLSTAPSFAALLVNYQFETVDGAVATQTTPDSSGTFVSSNPTPLVNAMLGYGTTPGTDYPQQLAGPVANGSVQSLNPNNYMKFSSAVSSSGTANNFTRVEIADASSGALDAAFTNFSVALWLNPTGLTPTGNDRFAIGKIGGSGQRGWQIYSPGMTSDLFLDYFVSPSGAAQTLSLTGVLPQNTWTHVAVTYDGPGGVANIYINGALALNQTTGVLAAWNGANNQPFRVGHRGATGGSVSGWIGGIDDVRLYNETLSANQVQDLMTAVPEPSGVVLAVIALGGAIAHYRRCRRTSTLSD